MPLARADAPGAASDIFMSEHGDLDDYFFGTSLSTTLKGTPNKNISPFDRVAT